MPAEWALHERSWMMWPSRVEVWPDMAATRRDYAAVAHAIREFEPLTMKHAKSSRIFSRTGELRKYPSIILHSAAVAFTVSPSKKRRPE